MNRLSRAITFLGVLAFPATAMIGCARSLGTAFEPMARSIAVGYYVSDGLARRDNTAEPYILLVPVDATDHDPNCISVFLVHQDVGDSAITPLVPEARSLGDLSEPDAQHLFEHATFAIFLPDSFDDTAVLRATLEDMHTAMRGLGWRADERNPFVFMPPVPE